MRYKGLDAAIFSLDDAINNLVGYLLKNNDNILTVHEYCASDGRVEFYKLRIKDSRTEEKHIFPLHINKDGLYVLLEPEYPKGKKPLYKLPDIKKSDCVVFVTEGEICVDKLVKLGLTATTSGSWNSAIGADWSALSGKIVIIWPDADIPGMKYANNVAEIILQLNCKVSIIDIEKLNLYGKEDCVDWLAQNSYATSVDILNLPVIPCELESRDEHCSKATLLLQLVKDVEFFHDEQNLAYATIRAQEHNETLSIGGDKFSDWLSRNYWEVYREVVSAQTLMNALSTMRGMALYEGDYHPVFSRVGSLNGEIYINLANTTAQTIKISWSGWEVVDDSPIKFIKSKNMKALPIPLSGGDLDLLWKYVNIPEEYKKLVTAWLLECLRPATDYPILVLHGTQGSAKSTTQQFLCNLIDPGAGNLRTAPKNADDIMIAVANSHLLSFNNLSKLTVDNQNDLCCVSTGGAFAKRELYSDLAEVIVETKRPLILNGINNFVTANDLASRCVIIELPEIEDINRKPVTQLQSEFIEDYPSILGGLYDLYVAVLKVLPDMRLVKMPRLADFTLLGTAMEKVLGLEQGAFMASFENNIKSNMYNSLEEYSIIEALVKFISMKKIFKGTFADLLCELSGSGYKPIFTQGWPNSPHALARLLKELSTPLCKIGISIKFPSKRSKKGKIVEVEEIKEVVDY